MGEQAQIDFNRPRFRPSSVNLWPDGGQVPPGFGRLWATSEVGNVFPDVAFIRPSVAPPNNFVVRVCQSWRGVGPTFMIWPDVGPTLARTRQTLSCFQALLPELCQVDPRNREYFSETSDFVALTARRFVRTCEPHIHTGGARGAIVTPRGNPASMGPT